MDSLGNNGLIEPCCRPEEINVPAMLSLFSEVNEHIRAVDVRNMNISVSYFGVVAIALSILGQRPAEVFVGNIANRLVYGILIVHGLATYATQRWYRVWKEHYMCCVGEIATLLGINNKFSPFWVRNPNLKQRRLASIRPNFDNVLSYFTALLTIGAAALFGHSFDINWLWLLWTLNTIVLVMAIRLGMQREELEA